MFFSDELPRFVYYFPRMFWPFIQLSRPYHVSNVLAISFCGLFLAEHKIDLAYWLFIYGAGTFLILGVGATFNDIVDRSIDAKYLKAMSRPIPSGRISLKGAICYLLLQLALAFLCWLALPWQTKIMSLAILGLILMYPFAKRFTNYAQFILGVATNVHVFLGYYMFEGKIDLSIFVLFLCTSLIVIIFDSIYEYREYFANKNPKIKSTAFAWGEKGKLRLYSFALLYFGLLLLLGKLRTFSDLFFMVSVISFVRIFYIIYAVNLRDAVDCNKKFLALQNSGWFVLLAIAVGCL